VIPVRLFRPAATFVMLGVLSAGTAGCREAPTAPSHQAPFSQTDLREGTGEEAVIGNLVTMHYTGWLYDETQPDQKGAAFDSSAFGQPFTFILGFGQVIPGWDQGIPGMRVGGLRRLVIPSSLAYGGTRSGPIPPNATLVFEVELLEVE
jgi:FKBP-type peptidyl-prolyl cis-trans isomerase FkpA